MDFIIHMQYKYCYLLPFDLWTLYLERTLFLIIQGYLVACFFLDFSSFTKILNEQQSNFQVRKEFINVSKSFFLQGFFIYHSYTRK